jgi:RNA polymerase sigma-70 factor (ECF subfamily)
MSNSEDIKLIEECLNGESRAFGQLVERYQKPLFNAALKIVNDWDTAKDVTQTVFIKAYEKLDTYNRQYKFFSWIYRMAVNEAINALRHQKSNVDLAECQLESGQNPEKQFKEMKTAERIDQALANLPIDYRMVTVFYYFANLAYDEISFVLGIPEKKVKSRLYSARQILAKSLSGKELAIND